VENRLELYFKLLDVTKALKLENMNNNKIVNKLCIIENQLKDIIGDITIKKDKQS